MSALALSFDGDNSPIMLTTRQIADATGKLHLHVIRDAKAMIIALYAASIVERTIPASLRSKPSVFVRDNADAILCELSGDEPNWVHPSGEISWTRDARGYIVNIVMDQSHALTLATGYDVVKRKQLVDYCRRLEAERRNPVTGYVTREQHEADVAALQARVAALEAKPAIPMHRVKPDAAERISTFIRKRGSVTRSAILREFRDLSAAELNGILDRLGVAGQVVVALVKQHTKKYGRPAEVCRWMQ